MSDPFLPLLAALDDVARAGQQVRFWLRDDDAVAPSAALDRLLRLGADHGVPLTLAVIPQHSGAALVDRLAGLAVEVAVHGWSHENHARPGAKSCELGPERAASVVLAELTGALARIQGLHGARAVPVLVPPWNRIDPGLIPALGDLGFRGLSVFGPEPEGNGIARINAHVDLIDWRGHRGGRATQDLVSDLIGRLAVAGKSGGHVGFMTHHLVHDHAAWKFTELLFTLTANHPGCRWVTLASLLPGADQTRVS